MKLSMRYRLTAIGVGLVATALIAVACSGDDNGNPVITPVFDGGTPSDSTVPTGDSSTPTGDSSTPTGDSSPPPSDSSSSDSAFVADASLPDVGACVSDAAPTGFGDAQVCNSCYTPTQDPINGCSAYAVNCVPYDNSQLPDGAP
jgi:hypothetical protein